MNVDNDIIKIKGYTLKKDENETYIYSCSDFDIIAYKFLPGKMKIANVEYLDICTCILIDDNYYIYYGRSRNGKIFCLQ